MAAGQLYRLAVAGIGLVAGSAAAAQAVKFHPIENMCVRYDHQCQSHDSSCRSDQGADSVIQSVREEQRAVYRWWFANICASREWLATDKQYHNWIQ